MYKITILIRIFALICFLVNFIFTNNISNFVYNNDNLFIHKSVEFVETTSKELFNKTGVSLYVNILNSLDSKPYSSFRDEIILSLKQPFVVITLIKNDKKIDIISSDPYLIDTNKVYWEYMVPLIPFSDHQLTPQILSAVVLNGYIESVDLIAEKFGVKIEHNISKDEKGAKIIAKVITYIMLSSMIILFLFVYYRGASSAKK